MNKQQRRMSASLDFVKVYDGGSHNCRKAKRVGRQRLKRASAKSGRREVKSFLQLESVLGSL
jgi:hypothetical protein